MDEIEWWADDRFVPSNPLEWWEQLLEEADEPESLAAALKSLTDAGCRQSELLLYLSELQNLSNLMKWSKRAVESYHSLTEKLLDRMRVFVSTQAASFLPAAAPLSELEAHSAHVSSALKSWSREDHDARVRRELIDYVSLYAKGRGHKALARLISEVAVRRNAEAIKVETSRVRKAMGRKPPKTYKGRVIGRQRSGRVRKVTD
jgi:hypothetical protein